MDGKTLRETLLKIVEDYSAKGSGYFQLETILKEAGNRLDLQTEEDEQALLTFWYDLFRSGMLAWGFNLDNPEPPWVHLTDTGREALRHISGDPLNKDGYLAKIVALKDRNPIAWSYIEEAVETFSSSCFKATAVMLGAAAEAQVHELRDEMLARLATKGAPIPAGLNHWKIKTVRDCVDREIQARMGSLPQRLREVFSSYWGPLTESMRITRNDAGHPKSVNPVEPSDVHAGLLLFPHLVELVADLKTWVTGNYPTP